MSAAHDAEQVETLADVLVMTPMADFIGTDIAPVHAAARAVLASDWLADLIAKERAEAWDEGWNAAADSNGFPGDVNPYRATYTGGTDDTP